MVVGHTLTSGVIESRFGGKHVSIDTGMLELYDGGHRAALEIERRIGDHQGQVNSFINIGNVYEKQGKPEEALKSYRAALEITERLRPRRLAA